MTNKMRKPDQLRIGRVQKCDLPPASHSLKTKPTTAKIQSSATAQEVTTSRAFNMFGNDAEAVETPFEITLLEKDGGSLSKVIDLKDGEPRSNADCCWMATGRMSRLRLNGMNEFAKVIAELSPNQAIALGAMRAGLGDVENVVTKRQLANRTPDRVTRTKDNLHYTPGNSTVALWDFDRKEMPEAVNADSDEGARL